MTCNISEKKDRREKRIFFVACHPTREVSFTDICQHEMKNIADAEATTWVIEKNKITFYHSFSDETYSKIVYKLE